MHMSANMMRQSLIVLPRKSLPAARLQLLAEEVASILQQTAELSKLGVLTS
jgi:hypothetical protein